MNIVLSPAMVKKALTYKDDLHQEICPQCIEHLIKAQDLHTKSLIADEVRKIENPYTQFYLKNKSKAYLDMRTGFDSALQAVLKLLEAKE